MFIAFSSKSLEIDYQYDYMNRITDIDYGSGYTIHFDYDDYGNRTSMVIQGDLLEPTFPENIVIDRNGESTVLSWDAVNLSVEDEPIEVDYYIVYYSDNPEIEDFTYLGNTSSTTYTDNVNDSKRFYYITAFVGSERDLNNYVSKKKNIPITKKKQKSKSIRGDK
jgi:YD repeat-containing protein